jgi:hypothetical protein
MKLIKLVLCRILSIIIIFITDHCPHRNNSWVKLNTESTLSLWSNKTYYNTLRRLRMFSYV